MAGISYMGSLLLRRRLRKNKNEMLISVYSKL